MGIINAGYDNFGTPWLQVQSGGGTPYNIIQNSIGQGFQYGVNGLYMKANALSQILQPVVLEKNNRRGIFEQKTFAPIVDPYQFVAAIISDVVDESQKESLTFNGMQNFIIPIEAGESVVVVFSVREQGMSNLISGPNNFERLDFYDYLADFPEREAGAWTERDILIQLTVRNNSLSLGNPFTGRVSLLGGAPDTYNQSVNNDGLWSWSFPSPEPFNITGFTLQFKKTSEISFNTVSISGSYSSAQQMADALNSQTSLGLFWVNNSSPNPVLMTTNDALDFGDLNYQGTL